MSYEPLPIDCIKNNSWGYSLINSVAFHPSEDLFCAAFSSVNQLINFRIDQFGQARVSQVIKAPEALLGGPQHVVFTPDGHNIIAVNWSSEAFTIYRREAQTQALYGSRPVACIPFPAPLAGFKPHGMDISPSGKLLTVAFGWITEHKKAIGLFSLGDDGTSLRLLDSMQEEQLPGVPKGIAFSPDETCLLVTYADMNCICIYEFDRQTGVSDPVPKQIFEGTTTRLFRPEDIKLSRDGSSITVSNSEADCVASYAFDRARNRITEITPTQVLENPDAHLKFPHGIAFSPNGALLVVSQFGPLPVTSNGNIVFGKDTPRRQARINIYRHQHAHPALKSSPWRRSWSSLMRMIGPR
ncbi:MAG: Lactonase, 7-bladed beta-propeller [Rhodoferax sp.]|nr:Lactonase, 7-bladed beta-propeller [Rhodoferax sp.]